MKFKEDRKVTLELTAAEYKTIYSILMNIPETAVYNIGEFRNILTSWLRSSIGCVRSCQESNEYLQARRIVEEYERKYE